MLLSLNIGIDLMGDGGLLDEAAAGLGSAELKKKKVGHESKRLYRSIMLLCITFEIRHTRNVKKKKKKTGSDIFIERQLKQDLLFAVFSGILPARVQTTYRNIDADVVIQRLLKMSSSS